MQNLFNVAAFRQVNSMFELDIHNIPVSVDDKELEIEIKVPVSKFQDWLIFDERIEWELNFSDYTGSHVQSSGTMSFEEYFMSNEEQIFQDFYDYIVSHPINFRGQLYINSTESILSQFAKYSN